ncbi:MAG TPA: phosphoenolpyruvate synthase [Candidatus Nanopusillus sp.]|nr:phosphoenolpyruvate synthase [Candidatus Nanopusillus sp.]
MYTKWFEEISKKDITLAGGKGANLGEMVKIGIPVPPGFVVTSRGYWRFVEYNKLKEKIQEILEKTDINNPKDLLYASKSIQGLFIKGEIPDDLEREILEAYKQLSSRFNEDESFVAVRSSATAEDLPSIAEGSYVLVRINKEIVFDKIENVFKRIIREKSKLEVPSFKDGKIKWKPAGVYKHYVKTKLYKIRTKTGKEITITPDHSLIVLDKGMNLKIVNIRFLNKEEVYIPTILNIPIKEGKEEIDVISIFEKNEIEYTIEKERVYITDILQYKQELGIKYKVPLNEKTGYLLGIFVSEGIIYGDHVIVNNTNEEIRKKVLEGLRELGIEKKDKGVGIKVQSKSLARFLGMLCVYKKEREEGKFIKKIPEILFEAKKEAKYAFIAGLIDGSGCISDCEIEIITKHEMLAYELVYFLATLGILSILRRKEKYYRVIIPLKYSKKLAKDLTKYSVKRKELKRILEKEIKCAFINGLEDIYLSGEDRSFVKETTVYNVRVVYGGIEKALQVLEKCRLQRNILNEDIFWDEIESVEEIEYEGFVYDFIVPEYENFLANGIFTHNTASFAGQQATYLCIKGKNELLDAVKKCWASLWTARAIHYRTTMGFDHMKVALAVVIQKQIFSKKSGIMFTADPVRSDLNTILIEASWGLGESVVSGEVTPDEYYVDKKTLEVKEIRVNDKDIMTVYNTERRTTVKKEVPPELRKVRVLNDEEIKTLAKLGLRLEEHYNHPQDVEFAIDDSGIWIVQTRNITTIRSVEKTEEQKIEGEILLRGIPASPGVGVGKVKVILGPEYFDKFGEGDILVAKMTNPDYEPLMAKASAIVTDEGGINSHAAIVARELGKPCVVGTKKATELLKDGIIITVDGTHGIIYRGKVDVQGYTKKEEVRRTAYTVCKPITATKIMLIASHPEIIRKYRDLIDGIGLLRLEFLIAQGRKHPLWYLKNNNLDQYTEFLTTKLREILKIMDPKPVIVRTMDMRTDEYRNLEGGTLEPVEDNPMLGWHGIRRSLDQPELFMAELEAYKVLRKEYGFRNLWVMFPFVISWKEVKKAKRYMRKAGIIPNKDIKLGIMVETPAAALTIKDIIKRSKIDFISFGTNDLTQLTLGIDRNNELLQKLYSEKHPAVIKQIKYVIKSAKKYNIYTSICGQAGSNPEFAETLVRLGIDSISVNPDAIELIRETVARAERKLLLDSVRGLLL